MYIHIHTYTSYMSICTWWYSSFFRSPSPGRVSLAETPHLPAAPSWLHLYMPAAATRDAWRSNGQLQFQWIKTSCSQFRSHQFEVNQPYSSTHIHHCHHIRDSLNVQLEPPSGVLSLAWLFQPIQQQPLVIGHHRHHHHHPGSKSI